MSHLPCTPQLPGCDLEKKNREYGQPWNDYKETDLMNEMILMIKEKAMEFGRCQLARSFFT